VQQKKALEFAGELEVLRFFPSSPKAIGKIAELIAELCADEVQARWLVDDVCKSCNEWPGPALLRERHASRYGKKAEDQTWPGWEKPATLCAKCGDAGYTLAADVFEKCDCVAGESLPAKFLELLNQRTKTAKAKRGETAAFSRFSEAELRRILGAE
jgi:hypothetical protein